MNAPLFVLACEVGGRLVRLYPRIRNTVTRWSHYVGSVVR